MTDSYSQPAPLPPVQQLQDSSALEAQALSASFHGQGLLPVPGAEPVAGVRVAGGDARLSLARRGVPHCHCVVSLLPRSLRRRENSRV